MVAKYKNDYKSLNKNFYFLITIPFKISFSLKYRNIQYKYIFHAENKLYKSVGNQLKTIFQKTKQIFIKRS